MDEHNIRTLDRIQSSVLNSKIYHTHTHTLQLKLFAFKRFMHGTCSFNPIYLSSILYIYVCVCECDGVNPNPDIFLHTHKHFPALLLRFSTRFVRKRARAAAEAIAKEK